MPLDLFEKDEKINLLIDIGTGSVSGALVLYKNNAKPTLIYSTRAFFDLNQKEETTVISSLDNLLGNVLNSIIKKGLLEKYFKNHNKHISSVIVSLSAPWFASKIRNIHLNQNTQFIVTNKFLNNILDIEEKNFEKELLTSEYENQFGKNLKIIENIVIQTKINGYFIKDSMNKKTKIFDASIYMSVVSKNIIDTIYNQISRNAHISERNIHYHTFPLVTFTVIRDLFPQINSFILIDITAEVTDVTLVLNDTIIKRLSFPSGRNFVIRQIAKKFGVSNEIAESLLHMNNSKVSDTETSVMMIEVLSEVEKEWSIYFEDAFVELSKDNSLPSYLYMTAENDIFSIYNNFIKLSKDDSTSTFRKNVNIININQNILENSYSHNNNFVTNEFIAILAVFFDKIKLNQ